MVKIAQVAAKTNLTAYTLRYYEKEGLIRPPRNENGTRNFDETTLRRLYAIIHYRRAGVSLSQIKEIFNTPNEDAFHLQILREQKIKLEREIAEMQETAGYLDYKIKVHEGKSPQNLSMEQWLACYTNNPEVIAQMTSKEKDRS